MLNIVNKMKLNSQILITLLIVLGLATLVASPVFAYSRSASVRVSCTILPVLEISIPTAKFAAIDPGPQLTTAVAKPQNTSRTAIELKSSGSLVNVNTNLGKAYQLTESLAKNDNNRTHLYSVTAI